MARFQNNLKNWRFATLWRQASEPVAEPGFQPGSGLGVRNAGEFKVLNVTQPSTFYPDGIIPHSVSGTDARRRI